MNKVKLKLYFEFFYRWLNSPLGVFLIGALIGLSFFIYFFEVKVINPSYIEWLLVGGDLTQHFLGWEFFRNEPWTFPLGKINSLAHPYGSAITYMDSIPLMAIPFKLFESWLPDRFQYIGIWGLLSYALQGGIAAIIIRRWTKHILIIGLITAIFVVNPMMLARMFEHTALGSHWIILAAIGLLVYKDKLKNIRYFTVAWSIVLGLAISIHPYFVPMVMLPLVISLILSHKTWLETLAKLAVPVSFMVIIFWIIGGLSVSSGVKASGLGNYPFNLNALVNPMGWSTFLRSFKNLTASGEGMNYLGLGVILLSVVALYIKLSGFSSFDKFKNEIKKISFRHLLVMLAILVITILAISPKVQLNQTILFELNLPNIVESLWSTFRASGRLFWVVYYLIVIAIVFFIIKSSKRMAISMLVIFLSSMVFLQLADIRFSVIFKNKHHHFENIVSKTESKVSPISSKWETVASGKKHLIFLDDMNPEIFFKLSEVALKYDLTINNGYFARAPVEKIKAFRIEQQRLIKEGEADFADNLYVVGQKKLAKQIATNKLKTIKIEDFIIIEPR